MILAESVLSIRDVSKSFGGVQANQSVSLSIQAGAIVGLIGPNGSGKTTLFNSVVGYHPVDSGSIVFDGTEITQLRTAQIARLGLLRTFQQTRIFSKMNCMKNMQISASHIKHEFISLFQPSAKPVIERAEQLLDFVGLYRKRHLRAGDLSFGQQKLLEFAMALMNEPKMLLLDEPTAGINPTLINGLVDRLKRTREELGVTLFVIEHNMRVIMDLADEIHCLTHGELLASGSPADIRGDQKVVDAYLGAA